LQEPGANGTEILNSLKFVRPGKGFIPNFPLTEKIEVNGENEHPLYTYLKSQCPPTTTEFENKYLLFYNGVKSNDVRWNFEKFLIGRNGKPVMRYDHSFNPWDIRHDIRNLLMHTSP